MERRDYLLLQIEQMSKAIVKILAYFFGLPLNDKTEDTIVQTNRKLKEELELDIDILLELPKNEILPFFQKLLFTFEHMEKIALYLKGIGDIKARTNPQKALEIYRKTFDLIDVIRDTTDSISFEHINLHKEVEEAIESLQKKTK